MCILTDKINNGYYCVPVYVFQALKKLGYPTSFDSIVNDLKVKIPTETECENLDYGITTKDALVQINALLNKIDDNLRFVIIPLNIIPYGMYEEFTDYILNEFVGVGCSYDYGYIKDKEQNVFRHISFLEKITGKNVEIKDYPTDSSTPATFSVDLSKLMYSINITNGGFWIITSNKNEKDIMLNFEKYLYYGDKR